MKETRKAELLAGIVLLVVFALWTVLIRHIDLQNTGPNGTKIGFSTVNVWFHRLTGVHLLVYTIPSSIALGRSGYEAHMQQILTPYGV